jgi:hypothetical protein
MCVAHLQATCCGAGKSVGQTVRVQRGAAPRLLGCTLQSGEEVGVLDGQISSERQSSLNGADSFEGPSCPLANLLGEKSGERCAGGADVAGGIGAVPRRRRSGEG